MKTAREFTKKEFELVLNKINAEAPEAVYAVNGIAHREYFIKKIYGQMIRLYDRTNFDTQWAAWKAAGVKPEPETVTDPEPELKTATETPNDIQTPNEMNAEPDVEGPKVRIYTLKDPKKVNKLLKGEFADYLTDRVNAETFCERTFSEEVYNAARELENAF